MADNKLSRPAENLQNEPFDDPFSDRQQPHQSALSLPRPYDSTTSLTQSLHDPYNDDDDEYVEKQPLNVGQSFTGGFYPPV